MHFNLKNKIIIAIAVIIAASTVFVNFFIEKFYKAKILSEFRERGESIARNLALNAADFILIEDIVALKEMAENAKKSEHDVRFVFIADSNNNVLVSTFNDTFPRDLLFLLSTKGTTAIESRVFNSASGLIYDIKVPILNGQIGSVHVGLSDKRINNIIIEAKATVYKINFILWISAIIIIYYITRKILAPLVKVAETVKRLKPEDIEKFTPFEFTSNDEVGIFAENFNMMMKKIAVMQTNLKETQQKLIQTAKFSSIGHFAAGLAHEINNPLSGMLNATRLILNEGKISNVSRKYLELIHKGILKIQNITKKVLMLSGRQQVEPRWTGLNDLIKEELVFFEHKLERNNILLKFNLKEDLPEIFIDPAQIQQVILNTVKNSIDAMENNGILTINTYQIEGYVVLEIKDNGRGIAEEELEKVFDPFYSTKEVGRGAGLGISLSYQIIRNHKGEMSISSRLNSGTTVEIKLPIISKPQQGRDFLNA